MRPNISIILPVYKPDNYIYDCIDSISFQSIDVYKFELLIILNGDKYPYYTSLDNYLQGKSINYKIFHTSEKGVSNARNIGIDNSQGDYIAFIDDDDLISKDYLYDMYFKIKDHKDTIVVSNVTTFNDHNVYGDDYLTHAFNSCIEKKYTPFHFRSFLSTVWGKLIPRELIANIRFNKNITISEDSLFMFTISKKIKNIILSDSDTFYLRRYRINSASRIKRTNSQSIKFLLLILVEYTRIYIKNPFKYNFWLYISRIVAALRLHIHRIYNF